MSPPRKTPAPGAALAGTLRFAGCELHLPARELWRNGERQPLPRRVFELLVLLISRRPATVTRAEIVQAVWGQAEVGPAAVAQAVLQARRAVGDDVAAPACIVTVHGVGYRFAASLRAGAPPASTTGPDAAALAELRARIDEAQAATLAGDADAALYLAEQAISQAESAGANIERARAMTLAAWAALNRGTMEAAAAYAYGALRLAEAEDHRYIAAKARVRIAQVLHAGGDLYGALQALEAIRIPDDLPDTDPGVLQVLHLTFRIHGDLQQFDIARRWCERAQRTALQLQPERRAILERIGAMDIELKAADAAREAGEPQAAVEHCRAAMAVHAQLQADVMEVGSALDRLCLAGNAGIALTGLGRVEEAWQSTREAARLLDARPGKGSPWHEVHLNELRLQRAALLGLSGRTAEALEDIEPGIASAEAMGKHGQVVRLATLAAELCQAAGRFEDALRWTHRSQRAARRQRQDRTAILACAYQSRDDREGLARELGEARAQLEAARAQVQQLTERLQLHERLGATESGGLVPAESFVAAMVPRQREAVARGLPCFVGVWVPVAASARDAQHRQRCQAVAVAIRQHLGEPALPVCVWPEGHLGFALDGFGERRALALCDEVAPRITAAHGSPDAALARLFVIDIAAFEPPEAAWPALAARAAR